MPAGQQGVKSIPRTCAVCGKEFLATKYAVDHGGGTYCGNKCRIKAQNYRGRAAF